MVAFLSALVSIFAFRFRGRASLEIELIALRHRVTVLRRQRPDRLQLSSLDRLLWVWLYRIWPQVIDAMVVVKPATLIQWHRNGFRLHWRCDHAVRGRPQTGTEIRDLIRRMSRASPLWGAPRIHGELLKLGIEISQAHSCRRSFRLCGSSPQYRAEFWAAGLRSAFYAWRPWCAAYLAF